MISEALNKGRKALYEVIRMKRQIGQIGWRSFSQIIHESCSTKYDV